jgi:acetyltransferase-like isoleucine patch superfamily enzyme
MNSVKSLLRPVARPVKLVLGRLGELRLSFVYFTHGEAGIRAWARRADNPARVLRRYGAQIAPDVSVAGPLTIVNGPLRNLTIGSGVHLGSEVFLDLTDRVTICDGATVSMRCVVITHFDVGHGPLAASRPPAQGPVTIGPGAYLGAACTVLHGLTVGAESIVAAGAVVTGDVPERGAVGGVPARALESRPQPVSPAEDFRLFRST